ncbi:hypothetical protein AVEN_146836-1 [Araneus ventricosus]|uniref:Mos1 transposase HTH domain-containing protein n=1 Tax=Araneus ventricosus TaxID=182803 RepID=A0A4Y2F2Q2_ARAVE|nr:hypothetical protein AVEN_146836-1 [Araneus ventricosus]
MVIRFLHLKKTASSEIHRQLGEVYGASVMSRKHVWKQDSLPRKQVCRLVENVYPRDSGTTSLHPGSRIKGILSLRTIEEAPGMVLFQNPYLSPGSRLYVSSRP